MDQSERRQTSPGPLEYMVMRKIKFDCNEHNAPAYSCNTPGDNSGWYYQSTDVDTLLNPRMWTKEMHDAWHSNLPNVQKAFEALKAVA